MAKITLDSIRESIDAKYGSFELELDENNTIELLHPIRLSKIQRDQLSSISEIDEDGEESDIEARLVGIVQTVAASDTGADKLIAAISPRGYVDLAILSQIVGDYMEGQKVGEASASQD